MKLRNYLFIVVLLTVGTRPWLWTAPKLLTGPETTQATYFNSDQWECACRDYPVGTILRVRVVDGDGKLEPITREVPITSRGPALWVYYTRGVHLDLSKKAYQVIHPDLTSGHITVQVTPLPR